MKLTRVLTISLLLLTIGAMGASAAKVTYPNQDAQKTFAQKFFDAKAKGDRARQGFVNDVYQHGTEAEKDMWQNLDKGLTPDGKRKLSDSKRKELMKEYAAKKKPSGFQGDPKDPGPQDWSDILIETDANGNVTGFKPRDYYERDTDGDGEVSAEEQQVHDNKEQVKNMDKDGDGNASLKEIREAEAEMDSDPKDGKISDEERQAWNDKEADKRENGPGSPGNVPPIADWDKDGDGQPDKGYKRSCWQCCPGQNELDECHYGWPGNCDNNGTCDISEICWDMPEVHNQVNYECHVCEYLDDWPDPCAVYGLYSSASCNSACNPVDACYPVYIDQTDGSRRTHTATRQDLRCYECGSSTQPPPPPPKCEKPLLDGPCVGHDCEGYDVCKPEGEHCHSCVSPPVECEEPYKEGTCTDTTCPSNQKCVPSGKCYVCVDKTIVEEDDPCENVTCASETDCKKEECVDGKCVPTNKDGSCDDGDACTEQDECSDGECKGTDVTIPSEEICKKFECDKAKGIFETIKTGSSCDDGDSCTTPDVCDAQGVCVGPRDPKCDDPCIGVTCSEDTACQTHKCVEGECVSENKEGSCDDQDVCTSPDQCSAGECVGGPTIEVPSDTQCTTYTCDASDGVKPEIKTGQSCDDGDNCTGQDKCTEQGVCVGRPITGCNDCEQVLAGSSSNSNCDGKCSSELCEAHPVYGDPNAPGGVAYTCYKCKEGIVEELQCEVHDSEYPAGSNCGGTCSSYEECKPIAGHDANCETCVEKPKEPPVTCESKDLKAGACPGTCNESTHTCSPIDPVPGLKCHACNLKDISDCYAKGMQDGICPRPDPCAASGLKCYPYRLDDGQACHYCEEDPDWEPDCDAPYSPGQCSGTNGGCPSKTRCRPKAGGCQYCQPMTGGEEEEIIGSIPGSGEEIITTGEPITTGGETIGWTEPGGGGTTTGTGEGITTGGFGGEPMMTCQSPTMSWPDCQGCKAMGGKCLPTSSSRTLTSDYATPCYLCEEGSGCPPGQVSTCQFCKPTDQCIPGAIIPHPENPNSLFMCRMCLPKDVTVESIEYIIIIVETPRGRYVLKRGKKGNEAESDFEAKQVMALAKVETSPEGVKQLVGMMGGGSSVFGNFASSVSLGDMSGLLTEGLDKGGKYGDNCLEKDFKEADFDQSPPPSSSGESGGSSSSNRGGSSSGLSSSSSQFGEDTERNVAPTGPVVACGQKNGEKAIAILDAHGRPVEIITQEVLKRSPEAVQLALQRAQSLSDIVTQAKQGGLSGIGQMFAQKMIDKATSAIETKLTEEHTEVDEEETVEPNDPFFRPPNKDKKKNKLFGILGSNKKARPVSLGSNLKMSGGGNSIGGATRGKEKLKVEHQWGLHKVGFTPLSDPNSAWHLVDEKQRNVTVAVIDSGLDIGHQDAPEYIWKNEGEIPDNGIDDDDNGYIDDVNGWNFLGRTNSVEDLKGHGSFVSGIIAAKTDNNYGMAGINPGAVIMPIKVTDQEGETNSYHIFRAIYYAIDNGADIINISLGARGPSDLEQAAMNYAFHQGVFVATAAGNIGENIQEHGPSSEKGAFAVGSLDYEGTRSTISNWGANNGILAPGDKIISLIATGTGKGLTPSTIKKGFYPQSGTSFSSPIVAGTASLLLAQNPGLTNLDIEDILHRTAEDMYEPGWDEFSGAGLLNAKAALSKNVNNKLTVKFAEIRINKNSKKKIETVDVFGTVRGDIKEFYVEVGKGKRPKDKDFEQVAGPFTQQATHNWLAQINVKEHLRGSSEWVLRIRANDNAQNTVLAHTPLILK